MIFIRNLFALYLITQLGADNFSVRNRADNALSLMGWDVRDALREGSKNRDIEISRRCEDLYTRARNELLESFEPIPEIDAAWYDLEGDRYDHTVSAELCSRYTLLVPYLDATGRSPYPYLSYVEATRNWLCYEIDSDANLDELRELLKDMRYRDSKFLRSCPGHYLHKTYKQMYGSGKWFVAKL